MAAPITSYGYAGTIAPNEVWARMQMTLGNRFFVLDASSVAVSAVAGSGRQVKVTKGTFGGAGVLDDLTQDFTFQLPASSTETWFLIVARRIWGVTQKTDFVAINAGSGASLPERSSRPGTEDDQPIALVQVRVDGTVGTVRDLRIIGGHGNFVAYDDLVRTYLLIPGATLRIGSLDYTCAIQSGTPTWVRNYSSLERQTSGLIVASGASVIALEPGWVVGENAVYATRYGNVVDVSIDISRTGSSISVDSNGGVNDTKVGSLTPDWRPFARHIVAGYYIGGDASGDRGSYGGTLSIDPNGSVYFVSGTRNMNLNKRDDGGRSLSVSATFVQR